MKKKGKKEWRKRNLKGNIHFLNLRKKDKNRSRYENKCIRFLFKLFMNYTIMITF